MSEEITKDIVPVKMSKKLAEEQKEMLKKELDKFNSPRMRNFVVDVQIAGKDKYEAFEKYYPDQDQGRDNVSRRISQILQDTRSKNVAEIMRYLKNDIIPNTLTVLAATSAVDTLADVMHNGKSEKARVQAAKIVLDHGHGLPEKVLVVKQERWHGDTDLLDIMKRRRLHMELNAEDEVIDVEED